MTEELPTTPPPHPIQELVRIADAHHAVGSLGRFMISIWRGIPTRSRLASVFELYERYAIEHGRSLAVISVIESGSPPPSDEDLPFVHESFSHLAPRIEVMVGVFEVQGAGRDPVFEKAELVAGGVSFPVKACVDVDEACSWIVRRVGSNPDVRHALKAAVEATRLAMPRAT